MSAIRNRSSNTRPSNDRPMSCRTGERGPSGGRGWAASGSYRGRGPAAGHEAVGLQLVKAVGRLEADARVVGGDLDVDAAVLEAQVDAGQLPAALVEELLHVILLEVDERGHLVPALRQEVELVEQPVAVEDLAELPGDALLHRPLADAESVEDLERPLGVAQAAGALAELGLTVDEDAGHGAGAQVGGEREADRSAADDHDRVANRAQCVLVGRAPVGAGEVGRLC